MADLFIPKTGAYRINHPLVLFLFFISLVGVGYFIAENGILAVAALLVLPFAVFFLIKVFENPVVGFFAVYVVNFVALGLARYVLQAPFGLLVDGFLVLTFIAIFFKYFNEKFDWSKLNNPVVYVALIWFGYSCFELVNPAVASRVAWIYSVRSVSMYMLFTVILMFILMDKYKYFMYFIYLWMFFEVLGSVKGMIQLYVGLDPYEDRWLAVVGYSTHILFGKLRVFSFFTDAGQFGATQGHAAMVAAIIALTTKSFKERVTFFVVAIFCFYGMFISGTRGIWGVLAGTGVFWLLLNRNFKLFFLGLGIGIAVIIFFRYTYIGQGIYFIQRMRSAFDPNNPSLLVRLENQAKLRPYLALRPFGGGLGNAGTKAQRFTPSTFLANTATDSWYVEIWAEQGVVGLALHLGILAFILIKGSYIIMHRIRDPELKGKMIGIISGIFGIMVSSYGNGVYGQMPTGLLMYSSMAFIFLAPKYDQEIAEKKAAGISLFS
ncbi:MAG: O-antigen ligase domain-containing protein [Bacteroidetes bacterium]|nr:MAG: O-antigen ligase domain-containing protein [Bacteroidota bacterium]